MDSVRHAGYLALVDWRQALLDAGVPPDSLPLESDLELIAATPHPEEFATLGIERLDAVRKFQPGILSTVRSATRAAVGTAPAEPVQERKTARSSRRSRAAAADTRATAADAGPQRPAERTEPVPEPAPPPEPAPVPFALRDPTAPPDHPRGPVRSLQAGPDGSLTVRWDAADDDAPCHIYRVVTSDRYLPASPEGGDLRTVTSGTEFVDPLPFTGALRHVQVWVNSGPSDTAARLAQPVLLCQGTVVAPVTNVDLREDQGWVSCAWDEVPAGIDRVEVLRIPAAADRAGYWPQYLISEGKDCRTGFQDTGCQPGETYEYRMFSVATVDGVELMTGVDRRITISAPLHAVDDLRTEQRVSGDRVVVDLTWTPVGTAHVVEIFRTVKAPEPGVTGSTVPVTALAAAGLPADARLIQPVQTPGGIVRMEGVAWPTGWDQVYFTAVTVDREQARVGVTRTLTRPGEIHDVKLVQRVDWQLLTLDWPTGAAQVQVFLTMHGVPLAEPPGEPAAQLARAAYDKDGGLRLRDVLPGGGCDVHVVPVTFYAGQIFRGPAATVSYGGVVNLTYRLTSESSVRDRFFGGKGKRVLEVYSDDPLPAKRLILVHNEQRLPLDARDGQAQVFDTTSVDSGRWCVLTRMQCDPDKPGYFRLFADVNPDLATDFAVLDPPLSSLRGGVA